MMVIKRTSKWILKRQALPFSWFFLYWVSFHSTNGRNKNLPFFINLNLIYYHAFSIIITFCSRSFIIMSFSCSWCSIPSCSTCSSTCSGSSLPPPCTSSLPNARGTIWEGRSYQYSWQTSCSDASFCYCSTSKKEILRINQNKNNIKLYQATGTNQWVRPPVPKSTMDKNKPRRNSAGYAR